MVIAKLKVSGTDVTVESSQRIPAGAVGLTLQIEYDNSSWDQLRKTVVFRSHVTKDVVNAGNEVTIPAEVLALCNEKLYVGIYGTDANGLLVVPTLWANLGRIFYSTDPSGDESTDPSLPVWAQIQRQVNDLAARMENVEQSEDLNSGGDAVQYVEQTLTEVQKTQARANIGAATVDDILAALPVYNGEVEQ